MNDRKPTKGEWVAVWFVLGLLGLIALTFTIKLIVWIWNL